MPGALRPDLLLTYPSDECPLSLRSLDPPGVAFVALRCKATIGLVAILILSVPAVAEAHG